ncbi:TlpA family protein disulfide reductase [Haloterrigena sp. SYSU A558-1]|uniref:TlpA family protein disulfide reductase n=1 Tax=Haloterrigena gelatinilytica TaxID=2741724 RepID=A0ABX2LDB3_9EURY|nr:TlpA disulfide reductase family protein [Haloterrigena gelatinilytica]NUC74260.1 TlpA family protein disulfide reductase [Haloterrigena gelatinilytica]
MKRRAFIAGTAVLAAGSGCLEDGADSNDGDESNESAVELTTVDAPGSEGGTIGVPSRGQVQLVNCIRTTCPTSRAMLSRVGEARDELATAREVGPDGDVHVVSVVDEYSGAASSPSELADWWAEQDGDWTLAVDEDGALFEDYGVTGTPTTLAVDGAGEVHWRDEGGTTATNLVSGVETALEASDS